MKYGLFAVYGLALFLGWGLAKAMSQSGQSVGESSEGKPIETLVSNESRSPEESSVEPPSKAERIKASLKRTDDPGAAFQSLFERNHDFLLSVLEADGMKGLKENSDFVTLGLRFMQWFELEPSAACAAFSKLEKDNIQNALRYLYLFQPLEEAELDLVNDLDSWKAIHSIDPESSINVLVDKIGKTGDVALLKIAQRELPSWFESEDYGYSLGQVWPFEKRNELLSALPLEHRYIGILQLAVQTDPVIGLDWFISTFRAPETPQVVRDGLMERMDWIEEMVQGSTRPVEEKAALLREFSGKDATLSEQVVSREVTNFLRGESDQFYQFHNGLLDANELQEALYSRNPSLRDYGDDVRSHLFVNLAESDLSRALSLLEGESSEFINEQKLRAANEAFRSVNPEKFLELMESMPAVEVGLSERMQVAWSGRTEANLERFGADYLRWVSGIDDEYQRRMALEGVVEKGQNRYPDLVEQARDELKQP
ncbi:MAG: hypothetical protein ACSHYB_08735 [Roseibacillus sp.]